MTNAYASSPSIINDLTKVQIPEKVVYREPSQRGSSLNNTNISDQEHQYKSINNDESRQSFIDAHLTQIQLIDPIKTHKAWSIFNILCCCWFIGCIACVFSMKTETLKKQGDIQGASNASKKARMINIISTMFGIISIIIYFLYQFKVY